MFLFPKINENLVERMGGFVQIDAFIFPFVKNSQEKKIYIHINDVRHRYHQCLLIPSRLIRRFSPNSSLNNAYRLISEHARENYRRNSSKGNSFLSKFLPNPTEENIELNFLALDVLLRAKGFCFAQIFEFVSLENLIENYRNKIDRQFIIEDPTRHAGLIDWKIPFLRIGSVGSFPKTFIPTETKTSRPIKRDERLFINSFLLYHGYTTIVLRKRQRFYLEQIDDELIASTEQIFDKDYYENNQRLLFSNS